jgi:uncharacterized membrane protein
VELIRALDKVGNKIGAITIWAGADDVPGMAPRALNAMTKPAVHDTPRGNDYIPGLNTNGQQKRVHLEIYPELGATRRLLCKILRIRFGVGSNKI